MKGTLWWIAGAVAIVGRDGDGRARAAELPVRGPSA